MDAGFRKRLLEAVRVALTGDWQAAHLVAQDHEGEPLANWLHAIVHRMEGDLGNAGYWYARCEKRLREDVSTEDELRELQTSLETWGSGGEAAKRR